MENLGSVLCSLWEMLTSVKNQTYSIQSAGLPGCGTQWLKNRTSWQKRTVGDANTQTVLLL